MRKLQIEDADVMRLALQQEIARSEESRYDHRLHGLLLVTAGQSCRQVADLFGENGGPVLSEHLRRHYRLHLGVRQCQRLFRRMGFRLRKPRPQVAQADPLKVAEVKKTPPPGRPRRR